MKSAGIIGIAKYLPDRVMTNQDIIEQGIDSTDEWIVERTGIRERRIADPETSTSDLAYGAALAAMRDAGVHPSDIDLVIVSTSTPDHPQFPSVACLIQDRLGIPTTSGAFDVSAACSGFNYALTTAFQYVKAGHSKNVLVVSADTLSKYVDWTDRRICILFGDGAGAAVVSEVPEGYGDIYSALFSNGAEGPILCVPKGGSRDRLTIDVFEEKSHLIYMNGKAVFKVAVSNVVPAVEEAVKAAGLSSEDIDLLVFHQANKRIIDAAKDRLSLPNEKVIVTVDRYGNTSAASIPIAMSHAKEQGRLNDGDIVVLVGFGAGFTWGVNIIKWSESE